MKGQYFFDGLDLYTTYGVIVNSSKGLFSLLVPKKPQISKDWPDEHGEEIDLENVYFQSRNISLDVTIEALNESDLQSKMEDLLDALTAPGLHQLKYAHKSKVFMVRFVSPSDFVQIGHLSTTKKVYGKFSINLSEPLPVNRQFTTDQSTLQTVTFNITSEKSLDIFWGDGSKTELVNATQATHNYSSVGSYNIVVAGDIKKISALTVVNATEI